MGSKGAVIAAILLIAGSVSAEPFVVQIGAFRNPQADFGARAAEFGTLSTSRSPEGLTRFEVGTFANEREARRALASIHAAGYTDAFVRRQHAGSRILNIRDLPAVGAGPGDRHEARLARLPSELRSRVVILDGVLSVKEGERFIPLDEYEGGRWR